MMGVSTNSRARDVVGRFAPSLRDEPALDLDDEPVFRTADDNGGTWWTTADGTPHRTDGPAVTRPDGTQEWYLHGELHRTDGPAVESPDGYRDWRLNGCRHRTDGPALTWPDGD